MKKKLFLTYIYLVQALALLLALGGGWLSSIPWWQHINSVDQRLWLSLALGVLLSLSSTWIIHHFLMRGSRTAHWFIFEYLEPISQHISPIHGLLIALASGICEEALFRGWLVPLAGIGISSIVFGLLHTGDRRLTAMGLWAGCVGLALAYLYELTGSLTMCMAVHFGNNATSFLLLPYYLQYLRRHQPAAKSS